MQQVFFHFQALPGILMKYRMLQNCFIRLSLFRYFLMQCSIISFMCTLIRVYQCV